MVGVATAGGTVLKACSGRLGLTAPGEPAFVLTSSCHDSIISQSHIVIHHQALKILHGSNVQPHWASPLGSPSVEPYPSRHTQMHRHPDAWQGHQMSRSLSGESYPFTSKEMVRRHRITFKSLRTRYQRGVRVSVQGRDEPVPCGL